MIIALVLVLVAGFLAAGRLLAPGRLTIFVAAGFTLAWGQWLLLTLIAPLFTTLVSTSIIFLFGAGLLTLLWLSQWRAITIPGWHNKLSWSGEAVPIVATLLVILGAWPILAVNGWHNDSWVMRGFYHGDTTTFVALVQKSLLTDATVHANPFAANGPLEYPTLLHAGLAHLLISVAATTSLLAALPWLTVGMITITVPLLFLLWDAQIRPPQHPHQRWFGLITSRSMFLLQLGLGLYVLTLSWDTFVYPQSHFFLTGLFLLVTAIFIGGSRQNGLAQLFPIATAISLSLVLLWSNAVTGTAAVVMTLVVCGLRVLDRSRGVRERGCYGLLILVMLLLFTLATPGNAALHLFPQLSYTAVPDMMRLALVVAALAIAIFWHADRQSVVAGTVVALMFVAIVTFLFSSRNIVVENASRFFYHGILVGWPLLAYPLIRAGAWLRQESFFTSRNTGVALSLWALSIIMVVIIALPAMASGASTYDSLLRGEATVVPAEDVAIYQLLASTAGSDAVVLANPNSPWLVPFFTGRALLRTNYWLDPDDVLTTAVNAAFTGDRQAQNAVLQQADYLVLTTDDEPWSNVPLIPIWQTAFVRVWEIRD